MEPDEDEPPPGRSLPRAVIKLGGDMLCDAVEARRLFVEVGNLRDAGWDLVVVHGGGPQTSAHQERLGFQGRKVAGRRVTDAPTLEAAKHTLGGSVNIDAAAVARTAGLRAVGLCGASLLQATRRPPEVIDGAHVDYGFVGEVRAVDVDLLEALWGIGAVPVVSPLGLGRSGDELGQVFNINADTVASAVASALGADHLFMVTASGGVLRDLHDPDSRIPTLTPEQAAAAIADGTIAGGMIPKVSDAIERLEDVGVVHILGLCSFLEAAARPGSLGTALLRSER